jgi:hypothetical protein
MRLQGAAGALVAIAIGAILTYAVSFKMSGISIHTVGVIIMIVGVAGLAILLVRSVTGQRRRGASRRAPAPAEPTYRLEAPRNVPPVAVTRVSTDVYGANPGDRRSGDGSVQ